ncbi:MAG TPA: alpha/beta fold hydrolase [Gaiellaceae bacterium]|nr:alpha/beta fold hydrolase [Gaiellaceae bacterium]
MLVDVGDTRLWVEERGDANRLPLFLLHGGPGLDHTEFGDFLDPLGGELRLLLVDQRAQGRSDWDAAPETWTIEQMSRDVSALAGGLGLPRYAVLGHSYGAFVALRHAIDGDAGLAGTIVSSGVPSSRYLAAVETNLAAFEPVELREQVQQSWARESEARTHEDVVSLFVDQLPFHFADPRDPRIALAVDSMQGARFNADVLRAGAETEYGGLEVENRLGEVRVPMLVLAGRHDRVCVVEGAEAIAAGVPGAELQVLEQSAHMGFIEEPEQYLAAVRRFLASLELRDS